MSRKTVPQEWAILASAPDKSEPSTGKQNAGFVAEKPPYQDFNWAFALFTNMLQNAEQYGIMQWSVDTSYGQYGTALGSNGKVYQSQIALNVGNDPVSDAVNWTELGRTISDMQTVKVDTYNGSAANLKKTTNGPYTYNKSLFAGTGLDTSQIRSIRLAVNIVSSDRFQQPQITATYPSGATKIIGWSTGGGPSEAAGTQTVVDIPMNSDTETVTITIGGGSGTKEFEIFEATQRVF